VLHHDKPTGTFSLPWFIPFLISIVLFFIIYLLIGLSLAGALSAGIMLAYLYYEYMHYSFHRYPHRTRYYRRLKAFHLVHHKVAYTNFGVTTTLWDRVFGTHYLSKKKRTF
jgi:sterol desaturase/sphingolipid hydroxylase (fatty acid hydroxylase superfamily)